MISFSTLVLILVGLLGISIGSFLNVVVLRGIANKKLTGRSACPYCGHVLRYYELVPIFSYLVQWGRCRVCRTRLSVQYPLVEALAGVVFVAVYAHVAGPSPYSLPPVTLFELVIDFAIWSVLIAITVYDFRTQLIPNRFSYTFAALALVGSLVVISAEGLPSVPAAVNVLVAGPVVFAPFYMLWFVSKGRWLGLGDGKLALGIGFFLGLSGGYAAVLLAFWIGAVLSLFVIGFQHMRTYIAKRDAPDNVLTLKSEVPFGPFLVLGTCIVYWSGIDILTLISLWS